MKLLSWLSSDPSERVRRARDLLGRQQVADARAAVLDLDTPDALEIKKEAENQLAAKNLAAAVDWGRAGDAARAAEHFDRAESFHHGGLEGLFRDTRRALRDLDRRRFDPDDAEVAARMGRLVEAYPERLRGPLAGVGPALARAVLDLEDGRPDLALEALLELPDDVAPVLYERAQAARALGDPAGAASALALFAEHAPGHCHIGEVHTGVLRAELIAETGDTKGALAALRSVRREEPEVGGPLLARLQALSDTASPARPEGADPSESH